MLKRSYARACIVLLGINLLIVLAMLFLEQYPVLEIVLACIAVILFFCVTFIHCAFLRCLNCRKYVAPLRWSSNEIIYCPKCGKPFEYDR